MNHMKQVAQLLGVELGEEFKIKSFENNFKFTDSGLLYYNEYSELNTKWVKDSYMLHGLLTGKNKIIKISKSDNVENKPILTDKEKKYLSLVIEPFRDDVEYISKCRDNFRAFIVIKLYFEPPVILPYFDEEIRYKGMEMEKRYTIEELGL